MKCGGCVGSQKELLIKCTFKAHQKRAASQHLLASYVCVLVCTEAAGDALEKSGTNASFSHTVLVMLHKDRQMKYAAGSNFHSANFNTDANAVNQQVKYNSHPMVVCAQLITVEENIYLCSNYSNFSVFLVNTCVLQLHSPLVTPQFTWSFAFRVHNVDLKKEKQKRTGSK